MDLASRIQSLRKEAGLSQEALAELLGISRQALGKWESGASLPTLENLTQLAKIFHLSIDELITGESPQNAGEENESPVLRAESIEALLDRMEQLQQAKRTPRFLYAAVGLIAAAALVLSILFAARAHTLSQRFDALESRLDALASRPIDTSAIYAQVLGRLESEFTPAAPNEFYFDWELSGCDLKNKTMTLSLCATPRSFAPDDTLCFLLSPAADALDTLDEPITIAATAADGQFRVDAEIPLCARLDVYIQAKKPDGTTKQELAGNLFDLSLQFIPGFWADWDTFSYSAWNRSSISFSGAPAVSLTPAYSPAAPKPVRIDCSFFYGDELLYSETIDVREDLGENTPALDPPDLAYVGTITYYPAVREIEGQRYDYVSGAQIYWLFTLTDSEGNTCDHRMDVSTLE